MGKVFSSGIFSWSTEVAPKLRFVGPEGVVKLNPTAAEVLALCDGERSLDEIAGVLSARYQGADVLEDVRELVEAMTQKGLVDA